MKAMSGEKDSFGLEVINPSPAFHLSRLVPLNAISQLTGLIARLRIPGAIGALIRKLFVKLFRIDMDEASRPLADYDSIEDIFIRELAPGMRTMNGPVCSPCDGTLSISKKAYHGTAIQAKGHYYSLKELVFGANVPQAAQQAKVDLAHYTTIYLAPHNYHRVHSPVSGKLVGMRYIPGELWPVNEPFVRLTPRLFVRNERLIFDIVDKASGGMVHVVMVGALNVGRIRSPFWQGLETNTHSARSQSSRTLPKDGEVELECGSELGTFMLGSTVVMAWDRKAAEFHKIVEKDKKVSIQLGDSLLG